MTHDVEALRRVVEQYLRALERFDMEGVLACFTEDAFYSHPPYGAADNGGRRHEVSGHGDLVELFQRRGHRPDVHHDITHAAMEGDHGFVAGAFSHGDGDGGQGGGATGTFVSDVTLAPDGRIASYAAYASMPGVGAP